MTDDIAIKVDHVSKSFKLPHDKQNSIKGGLISLVRNGKRTYEKQEVLKDISFEIKKGEFFGIVGRNGSGKSTLLKMLAGIYTPTAGSIRVNGSLTPFIELGVGFNPELTGRENVFLNGALLGFNRSQMTAMYDDIVEFAELERFMDQKLKNYSSGMQVRLAFSIATRAESDILLLDEVLAVGDAAFQQKCYDYFEELKRVKRTVVFVSHDMSAVMRFCTKAIYVKNGELLHEGSPSEIADVYAEENLASSSTPSDSIEGASTVNVAKINSEVVKQTKDKFILEFSYESARTEDMYIGISILRDGISFAEIITPQQLRIIGSGKVYYTLDASNLNAGTYQIGCGIFNYKNRELLAPGSNKSQFHIKGNDITKGAAMKLEDTWSNAKPGSLEEKVR